MKKKYRLKRKVKVLFSIFILVVIGYSFFSKSHGKKLSAKEDDKTEGKIIKTYSAEELENMTTLERLGVIMETDKRVQKIIDNYNEYPEDLLKSVIKNREILSFALNYIEKKGNVYSDNVGYVRKGTIPLLLQFDERWGYATYGDDIIALNGCGPTALSMVVTGLTGDNSITPSVVATFALENNYYDYGNGTSWSLMSEGSKNFGLNVKELPLSKSIMFSYLEDGNPIIAIMGKGDFTETGHYIVMTGVKNGKIVINDSNSIERSKKLWDYEKISSQIRNLWVFSEGEL